MGHYDPTPPFHPEEKLLCHNLVFTISSHVPTATVNTNSATSNIFNTQKILKTQLYFNAKKRWGQVARRVILHFNPKEMFCISIQKILCATVAINNRFVTTDLMPGP